jgi:hypothetical protein
MQEASMKELIRAIYWRVTSTIEEIIQDDEWNTGNGMNDVQANKSEQ